MLFAHHTPLLFGHAVLGYRAYHSHLFDEFVDADFVEDLSKCFRPQALLTVRAATADEAARRYERMQCSEQLFACVPLYIIDGL